MELVLITEPSVMKHHRHQAIFRRMFENHKYSKPDTINLFLNDNNIKFQNESGFDERGNTVLAYKVNGINLFGIKY